MITITMKLKNAEYLRKKINLNGYSIADYASFLGISRGYLYNIIGNKRTPSPSLARKIANGLGLQLKDIFFADIVHK